MQGRALLWSIPQTLEVEEVAHGVDGHILDVFIRSKGTGGGYAARHHGANQDEEGGIFSFRHVISIC